MDKSLPLKIMSLKEFFEKKVLPLENDFLLFFFFF